MTWENASLHCQLNEDYEARMVEVKSDLEMAILREGMGYSGERYLLDQPA